MATAQAVRPQQQQQQKEFATVFTNATITEQQSILFVKKLLAVGVSSIGYLRNLFPEAAFGDRRLEDIALKILRRDSNCEGAVQTVDWLQSIFDAVEKKYLKTLVVGVYQGSADSISAQTLMESYTFKFASFGGVSLVKDNKTLLDVPKYDPEHTKRSTMQLLRTLIMVTQTLKPLPDSCLMSMKLEYNDTAPADYQPPGFAAPSSGEDAFIFDCETERLAIGQVCTRYDGMRVHLRARPKNMLFPDEDEVADDQEAIRPAEASEPVEEPAPAASARPAAAAAAAPAASSVAGPLASHAAEPAAAASSRKDKSAEKKEGRAPAVPAPSAPAATTTTATASKHLSAKPKPKAAPTPAPAPAPVPAPIVPTAAFSKKAPVKRLEKDRVADPFGFQEDAEKSSTKKPLNRRPAKQGQEASVAPKAAAEAPSPSHDVGEKSKGDSSEEQPAAVVATRKHESPIAMDTGDSADAPEAPLKSRPMAASELAKDPKARKSLRLKRPEKESAEDRQLKRGLGNLNMEEGDENEMDSQNVHGSAQRKRRKASIAMHPIIIAK